MSRPIYIEMQNGKALRIFKDGQEVTDPKEKIDIFESFLATAKSTFCRCLHSAAIDPENGYCLICGFRQKESAL